MTGLRFCDIAKKLNRHHSYFVRKELKNKTKQKNKQTSNYQQKGCDRQRETFHLKKKLLEQQEAATS